MAGQTSYNPMQTIKRHLFAMRNGVIADVLRRSGSPFKIIFGVNLPQLVEIAAETGPAEELAEQLWANTTTRESMLIAPMIFPRDKFSREKAMQWISTVPCAEVADVLCHRLLRHQDYALDLAGELVADSSRPDMERYTGLRLAFNLVGQHPARCGEIAALESARQCSLTRTVAASLAEEARFLMGED